MKFITSSMSPFSKIRSDILDGKIKIERKYSQG